MSFKQTSSSNQLFPDYNSILSNPMITIIRRNQRWLLLIVAIMTIIAFAWLYNTTDTERLGENKVAQMYGRTVYSVEVDRAVRLRQLAALLGMNEFLGGLSATARDEESAMEEFVWNLLVLQHQASANWLRATDQQVLDAIRSLPALNSGNGFDRERYIQLLQEQLAPRGLTERHLEDLIRDSLALDSLRDVVTSPVALTEAEVEETRQFFQKVDVTVVKVPVVETPELPEIPEEAVNAYFEENKDSLLSPPYRSIELATISLSPEDRELEGRARVDALQKVADRISQLHDQLLAEGADFPSLAKEAGAEVRQVPLFDSQGNEAGSNPAEPGPSVGLPANVVEQTFRTRPDEAVSEIIQDGDSFFVFRLGQEVAPRPLTLEEIGPRIREMLAMQAWQESEQVKAAGFRDSIAKAVADGQPVADAAGGKELPTLVLAGLEPWVSGMDQNTFYARSTQGLGEGEFSELQRGPEGWFFVRLDKRHPVDSALWAQRGEEIRSTILENKKNLLFLEWLRQAREASDLRFFAQQ
jgi:hypothetical protein